MTREDLQKGNELIKEIAELSENISILNGALSKKQSCGPITKFFLSSVGKNKIHIDGGCISFGGHLTVDRECMELLKSRFETKLNEANKEFESIGKGGAE